jgi:hypothetical protein
MDAGTTHHCLPLKSRSRSTSKLQSNGGMKDAIAPSCCYWPAVVRSTQSRKPNNPWRPAQGPSCLCLQGHRPGDCSAARQRSRGLHQGQCQATEGQPGDLGVQVGLPLHTLPPGKGSCRPCPAVYMVAAAKKHTRYPQSLTGCKDVVLHSMRATCHRFTSSTACCSGRFVTLLLWTAHASWAGTPLLGA